ncbi:MAG TPA: acyl-CoA dehydrogenase family protein [Egibacteraceae bacterium]|nr:acyl-CoA dehydrogenase family protein [Egibacteraceae bacterium]
MPDDCVVGEVGRGWTLARTTLANERVAMSAGSALGGSLEQLVGLAARVVGDDAVALDRLGRLVADEQTLSVMAHRTTLRQVSGTDPGPGASVRKLVSGLHQQDATEFGLELLGADGATTDGEAAAWSAMFLAMRAMTIAGGTTEVQRNLIAERLLGLPRDDA